MEEKDTNLEENNEQIKDEVVNDEEKSLASEENVEAKNEKSEPLVEQKVVEHFEYNDDHLAKIESNRNDFLKFYKKQNIWKWVIGFIGLAIIIFAWIGFPNLGKDGEGKQAAWVMPAMIVVVVVALLGIVSYSFVIKRIITKKMREYFSSYYEECNKYVFESDDFTEVSILAPDKIEKIQFTENLLYCNVFDVGSRGLTEFKYHDELMMVCDCAAQVKSEKSALPVFVGKYLVAPASYNEDPIFIYIKGDHRALPPTNLNDVKNVFDDDKMSIFSNNDKWAKVINAKVLKKLKAIKTGRQLVDVAIAIHSGKVYMCLGYDDPVMVLPLEHAFDPEPIMEFKEEFNDFVKLAEELAK